MDRKDFLIKTCALCAVPAALSAIDSCSKTTVVNFTIDLGNSANAALLTVGGFVIQNNTFVQNTSNGYVALSQNCTHQGCTVSYSGGASGTFNCPCHGGRFSVSGSVLSGPPPSALPKYTVTQNGNILTVKS
ncbi:MAG: Rieske (2Fe-2S) iron-sulfur domain protein [Bacteroidota bacterium]|nr:Rieske (2Fe-2S) iron-sulfur domain protein [Bacteroidota bacterium]